MDDAAFTHIEAIKEQIDAGAAISGHDVLWLLDQLAVLEVALVKIAALPGRPDGDIGDLWNAVDIAQEALGE